MSRFARNDGSRSLQRLVKGGVGDSHRHKADETISREVLKMDDFQKQLRWLCRQPNLCSGFRLETR
jgi:hypothetical protein